MNDPVWCQSEVARLSDLIQELSCHLSLAADARDEVAKAWNYRVGKEITICFLEPFSTDVGG
jgi:hypothetical protein